MASAGICRPTKASSKTHFEMRHSSPGALQAIGDSLQWGHDAAPRRGCALLELVNRCAQLRDDCPYARDDVFWLDLVVQREWRFLRGRGAMAVLSFNQLITYCRTQCNRFIQASSKQLCSLAAPKPVQH
jgi:hypothetical protein